MARKSDFIFDNEEEFMRKHPHFIITQPKINYKAILSVLRTGHIIPGVRLVKKDG